MTSTTSTSETPQVLVLIAALVAVVAPVLVSVGVALTHAARMIEEVGR